MQPWGPVRGRRWAVGVVAQPATLALASARTHVTAPLGLGGPLVRHVRIDAGPSPTPPRAHAPSRDALTPDGSLTVGELGALDDLVPAIFEELRVMARRQLS